jgi:hypothetical protein
VLGNILQVANKFVIGVSVLFSLGLVGCGGGHSSDTDNIIHFENSEELDRAIANYGVKCEGECPTNAGVLLARMGNDLSTCSFSVVAKDVILTNRHCIPDSIAYEGASCGDTVEAILMKNGRKDIYKCDKVLSFAKEYNKAGAEALDFAFLKLQRSTSVNPLPISQTGVQDNETLYALTATPDRWANPYGTILIQKKCQVLMNSLLEQTFTNPFAPVIGLKDCEVVHGNSGSALVDLRGEIKGVLQSTLNTSTLRDGSNALQNQANKALKGNNYGKGTNAVCLYGNNLASILPAVSKCDKKSKKYETSDEKEHEQLVQAKVDALNKSHSIFKFKELSKNSTEEQKASRSEVGTVTIVPDCIRGSKNNLPWLAQFERTGAMSYLGKYPSSAVAKYDQYVYTYTATIDNDLRAFLSRTEEVQSAKIELPLSEMMKGQFETFDLEAQIDGEEANIKIGFCEK